METPQNPEMAAVLAKITQLEQSVARNEKIATTGFDINKLYLFPNAKLPEKFRPIDFAKFDGTGDPKAHLTGYIGALSTWGVERDAMAQMFSQTLVGHALHWFTSLDERRKRSWKDICAAFIAQYDYNIQLEVTTCESESTKMDAKETFADFVKRWRAKAAQMKDRPSDMDQIQMIIRNLQPNLARHMVMAQACSDFKLFFDTGLDVKEVVQLGILDKPEPAPKPKKVYSGNSNALFGNSGYTNLPNTSTNTIQTEPINQIVTQNNPPRSQPRTFALSTSLRCAREIGRKRRPQAT
ncbi:hypothetical protein RHMOL_Rhmol06G0116100 [Rhododendron molle]|uniref:Uncharacterized protein n=1 Tax=Rhododendron molle TaxID=49168 RepID=A0ACC0NCD5_RHOML|nr:hypothetical protein RHMOL_Rhmol06G0116100 [Rhododendron molle]